MQGTYDKSRWFEMLKHGTPEEISMELESIPKSFLLSLTDNTQSRHTCIFYAVQSDNVSRGNKILEILLNEGADANYKDGLLQTALFYCCRYGKNEQTQMLINAGANPNHRDTYGQTALYYAAREGQAATIKLLLENKADPNVIDNLGQTAIFYSSREGKLEATKCLVEKGANLNHFDKTRNTPLTWAKKSGNSELIEYLLSKGAQDKPGKNKKEPETVAKKKDSKKKGEKKLQCMLMIVDEKGEKRPLTPEELNEFEREYFDIAKYWKDPKAAEELESMDLEELETKKPWEKAGKKLLNTLWRANQSWIFHEPVDPIKLNIPDYFDIVKRPMDFGTIKKKLNNNFYGSTDEFLKDIELVFSNCKLYNPPESDIVSMCSQVMALYQSQIRVLGLDNIRANLA
jgi:Bromodomain/Ankyrin repeats (3 copies)